MKYFKYKIKDFDKSLDKEYIFNGIVAAKNLAKAVEFIKKDYGGNLKKLEIQNLSIVGNCLDLDELLNIIGESNVNFRELLK